MPIVVKKPTVLSFTDCNIRIEIEKILIKAAKILEILYNDKQTLLRNNKDIILAKIQICIQTDRQLSVYTIHKT